MCVEQFKKPQFDQVMIEMPIGRTRALATYD